MSQPHSQNSIAPELQEKKSTKSIKRVINHEAILKLKEMNDNLYTMRRRNKYLQVRDQLNRSLTIQHQKKLQRHQLIRQQIKNKNQQLDRYSRRRMMEIQNAREKNMSLKDQIQKNIMETAEKHFLNNVEDYQTIKTERIKNQEAVLKFKESDIKQKQQKRKLIEKMQQTAQDNIRKFQQSKTRQSRIYKQRQSNSLINTAHQKEKQLQILSRMQEQMIKKHSESMQASHVVRNRLRQVLGDERRFTKLPSLKNNSSPTRTSTGHTQIIML